MLKTSALSAVDETQSVRAAWLHFIAGHTQSEVADQLGVSRAKAHRLIAAAMKAGYVKISVLGEVADCLTLEQRLIDRFGLAVCKVVPDLSEEGIPLKALGYGGAMYLQSLLEGRTSKLIGIGHGRTLMAAVKELPPVSVEGVQFISLLGGLTRRFMANPHDVIHRLAEQINAEAYVLPVPFLANSVEDKKVLMAQHGVAEVFQLIREIDVSLVGIGSVGADAQLAHAGMLDDEVLRSVRQSGAVGELLGHFYNAGGALIEAPFTQRIIAPSVELLKRQSIVAIAGGPGKVEAIQSVLNADILTGLITDERTATELLK